MENKAIITVKTVQNIEGENEVIELITEGKFYKEGEGFLATYDESEISGMEGTTTTLKIEDGSLRIIRSGTTHSNMLFKMGLDHVSLYSTPFGALEVTIKPDNIDIDVNEKGGSVKLQYKLEASGAESIDNSLELNIRGLN